MGGRISCDPRARTAAGAGSLGPSRSDIVSFAHCLVRTLLCSDIVTFGHCHVRTLSRRYRLARTVGPSRSESPAEASPARPGLAGGQRAQTAPPSAVGAERTRRGRSDRSDRSDRLAENGELALLKRESRLCWAIWVGWHTEDGQTIPPSARNRRWWHSRATPCMPSNTDGRIVGHFSVCHPIQVVA